MGCFDAMNIHVSSLTLFCVYTPQLILVHLFKIKSWILFSERNRKIIRNKKRQLLYETANHFKNPESEIQIQSKARTSKK